MNPVATDSADRLDTLGELGLIHEIRHWLAASCPPSPKGIGDDCAVIGPAKGLQVITVDPVILGRHFDERANPTLVGAKLLKRNLSDIAAMGAKPRAAVIALQISADTSVQWLRRFYEGLGKAALTYKTTIVGGDVAEIAHGFVASLTVLGEATTSRVLTRTGARAGDHLFVTGALGGSRQGHEFTFVPRLAEGAWLARQSGVRAMMDVSDGLAKDLAALTPRGCIPALDPERIPIRPAARKVAKQSGRPAVEHALTDGEDYELVFALDRKVDPLRFHARWRARFETELSHIGTFLPPSKLAEGWIDPLALKGYEHLR